MSKTTKPCQEFHGDFKEGCNTCRLWRDDPSYSNREDRRSGFISRVNLPCIYRGKPTGEQEKCVPCGGNVKLTLYECKIHGSCTLGKKLDGHGCCNDKCEQRVAPPEPKKK